MNIDNPTKQKLLLEYLISSVDLFSLSQPIVKPEYFDVTIRRAVEFVLKYFDSYRASPNPTQIEAETGVVLKTHEMTDDEIEYALAEMETFCRSSAIKAAIFESVGMYEREDYGSIETAFRDAITVSITHSAGVGVFEQIENLMERLKNQPAISTGYDEFDNVLGGGLRRKELLLLSANSGGGKSLVMANFGLNYCLAGYKVLYLSFELPTEMIGKRYLSMITNIGQRDILDRSSDIIHMVNQMKHKVENDLIIERLPVGTTPNEIRAFLKKFELVRKYTPDVLILDYLDLMDPNEKVSADNVFAKDKQVTEQVHQILTDYDMIGLTASQQNRSAVTAQDLNHSHIAGGISKINTTDIYVSIIFNDALRAAGEMHFEFLKTRSSDGVGKRIELRFNSTSLRVENMVGGSKPLILKPKIDDNVKHIPNKSSLSDLLDI